MMMDDYDGQMIFGDRVGRNLPDIRPTGEEKPRKKPHPGNLSRAGDRIRAGCMTSAHSTTCSTEMDSSITATSQNTEAISSEMSSG